MSSAQRSKTVQFWDDYYHQNAEPSKEWILHPSDGLLNAIAHQIITSRDIHDEDLGVLEIGCGTSCLARELYRYLVSNSEWNPPTVLATDVSETCIRQNQARDESFLEESSGRFKYQVLNVLDNESSSSPIMHQRQFNMILDKGCLDTFLFRSHHQAESTLMRSLLENVHGWLKQSGVYVVLSPRTKLKPIRDYNGFRKVERIELDESSSGVTLADLDPSAERQETMYMHVCHKNNEYHPSDDSAAAFADRYGVSSQPPDDDVCSTCGITFLGFRKGENISGRGTKYWTRRWRGHCVHCKMKSNS